MADLNSFRPKAAIADMQPAAVLTPEKPARLASYFRRIEHADLLGFLGMYPDAGRTFWADNGSAFAGSGKAVRLTASGENRFADVAAALSALADGWRRIGDDAPDGLLPRLLGGFAFLPRATQDPYWRDFPEALFTMPEIQLIMRDGKTWLILNQDFNGQESLESLEVRLGQKADEITARLAEHRVEVSVPSQPASASGDHPSSEGMTAEHWRMLVEEAVDRIRRREFDKVVLARTIEVATPADILNVLNDLNRRYDNCFRFMLELAPGSAFFGATPELLVRLDGGRFSTVAMAGSIRRGADSDEDAALASQLLSDPKERQEHAIVVESIGRKLAPWIESMDLPGTPDVVRLANIQHLRTDITGVVSPGASLLELVAALHPTPAVGGSPSQAALDWLMDVEKVGRGWYAGPIGWLDLSGGGTFAVAIRSAVQLGDRARLYAGSGLVEDSRPEKEWNETGLKFKPLLEALNR